VITPAVGTRRPLWRVAVVTHDARLRNSVAGPWAAKPSPERQHQPSNVQAWRSSVGADGMHGQTADSARRFVSPALGERRCWRAPRRSKGAAAARPNGQSRHDARRYPRLSRRADSARSDVLERPPESAPRIAESRPAVKRSDRRANPGGRAGEVAQRDAVPRGWCS